MAYYKDRSKANRGQPLEEFIRFANERYRRKGVAMISKQATEFIPIRDKTGKIASVKVEHKATVDFLGRLREHPIAIEAKNTNSDSIRFDAVQPHQAEYMDAFTNEPGTIGLVVVSFNMKRFFVVPWAFWSLAYEYRVRRGDRKAPLTVSAFGQTWNIPKKQSVRIEELNPIWEVPNHNQTYGLHYLHPAANYITTAPQSENQSK